MTVDQPFMMEQCLTCLLQNAIAASETRSGNADFRTYLAINIEADRDSVRIRNSCARPFSAELAAVLDANLPVDVFAARIRTLLSGPVGDRPGLGTIISYLVARECYGGITVRPTASQTSVSVLLRRGATSSWNGSDASVPASAGAG